MTQKTIAATALMLAVSLGVITHAHASEPVVQSASGTISATPAVDAAANPSVDGKAKTEASTGNSATGVSADANLKNTNTTADSATAASLNLNTDTNGSAPATAGVGSK